MEKLKHNAPYMVIATIAIIGMVGTVLAAPILSVAAAPSQPPQTQPETDAKWLDQFLEQHPTTRLSDKELEAAKAIALADSRVQNIIGQKAREFLAVDYVALNATQEPVQWLTDIHYNIANSQQIGILIDMSSKKVIKTEVTDIDAINDANDDPVYRQSQAQQGNDLSPTATYYNGFAIARLTGTSSTPKRIDSHMIAPTFTNQIGQTLGNVLLVNAQRSGATSGNACDMAHVSDRYWAQVGLYWKTSGQINYDDTGTGPVGGPGCQPVFPTGISYQAGYNYQFTIYGATSGWQIAMAGPGPVVVNYFGPAINTDSMQTSDMRTSVFFENKQLAGTNWAPQFGSNPNSNQAHWAPNRLNYQNWPTDVRSDLSCTNVSHPYPYDATKEVINHSLTAGANAGYIVSRMQTNYPRCLA